eukprot:g21987.t1
MDEIDRLKKEKDAVILAHFYVDGEIQDIADYTGDSLKLARDAVKVSESTIVFSGVHFMAESAKILNPEKTVLIPDLLAGCSLAESCPAEKLAPYQQKLRDEGHDFVTVAYINTTAAVKSLCDWIVTSGNAQEIIERIPEDKEILFVPDQHLGRYLQEVTGRKMILWPGSCMVHEIFSVQDLLRAKRNNPGSVVIAHPECPQTVLEHADFIGGTEKMRQYVMSIEEPTMFLMARWIRSANPGQPLQIVYFTWPSDGPFTGLFQIDIAKMGRRSSFNGIYLAQFISALPENASISLIGHSHGARMVCATLHLLGGGVVQNYQLCRPSQCTRKLRVVFLAAALDHHWLNPGERFGRAFCPVEALLNIRNERDLPLLFYPLRRPFSHRALARTGFTRKDRRLLGATVAKVAELDATPQIGRRHFWQYYFQRPEIAASIAPYIFFTDRQHAAAPMPAPAVEPTPIPRQQATSAGWRRSRAASTRPTNTQSCETACPSGVQYGRLIEPFRVEMQQADAKKGHDPTRSWFHRFILYGLFPYPGRLRWALLPARIAQFLRLDRAAEAIGLTKLLPQKLQRMQGLLPRLKPRSKPFPDLLPAIGTRRARVALFTGCVAEAMFGETNWATARVLQQNGCDVVIPKSQACCGAIHYHSGAGDPALELANQNVAAFSADDVDAVIINVAGCGSMLKDYGHMAEELKPGETLLRDSLGGFASKVKDVSEFLADLGPIAPRGEVPMRATYHDACHLVHAQQIRNPPRQLLEMIPGLELIPLAESDICCGAAGSYNLTEPEMADRLAARKLKNILDTNADAVITGNAGCSLQLQATLRKSGNPIRVLHPMDVLDASYREVPLAGL